jgi:hypothetical protein
MSPSTASLEQQREQVLEQMRAIDRLRRGTLSRHFLKRRRGEQTVMHGPYFVLQGYLRGKKFAEHVPAQRAAEIGRQVASYKHFEALAEQFVTLTDQITRLADESPGGKKNSRGKKSPPNASERPKPS